MLSLSEIYKAQAKYGISNTVSDKERISYEMYLAGCRRDLADRTTVDYYSWDKETRNNHSRELITKFVKSNNKAVDGFVDDNGELKTSELIDTLCTDIIDFGILRDALEDDEVQEIQINDYKTIWVVKSGKSYLYTDKTGKPYQFVSDTELHSTIDRLIYNPDAAVPRMTVTNPLLNARTFGKGYRVSAVNSSATTPDITAGFDFPVTSITIRKYAPSMLTFKDFIEYDSLTEEMARFLRLCGKADIRLVCVGPTSSGKTTLLNAVVWEIPRDQRLILIQNPTEIMVYERNPETGANLRNALHWEARDVGGELEKDATSGTMANMIAHTLRNTPDVIIPGEVRTPQEFFQMNRALKTGHRVLSTFHAYDGVDAIDRMANELSTLGGSITDYIGSLSSSIDIVVSQRKLEDGSRHVMTIEELTGKVTQDGKAETNILFRYQLTGETTIDAKGKKKICGYFEQDNAISDHLVQKFFSAGISKGELEEFIHPRAHIEGRTNLPSKMGEAIVTPEKKEEVVFDSNTTESINTTELDSLTFLDN